MGPARPDYPDGVVVMRSRKVITKHLVANEVEANANAAWYVPRQCLPRLTQENLGHCLKMHALLRAIGVLALIAGLGFMGNGFRFFAYPGERFMMVYYGAGIAVVGLLLIVFSRPSDEPRV